MRDLALTWVGGVGLAALMVAAAAAPVSGQEVTVSPPIEGMDARTHDLWQRHWRRFATKMIAFESDFAAMQGWEPRFPSSRGVTVEQYRKAKTVTIRERYSGAMTRPVTIVPPIEEGRMAAMALPSMRPGEYGHVHSFKIVEILGPEEMIVEDTWLIDEAALREARQKYEDELRRKGDSRDAMELAERTFEARDAALGTQRERAFRGTMRLSGFPTRGLHPDDRWPSKGEDLPVQIAVLWQEGIGSSRLSARRQRLVAVPAERFHRNLDETQFISMLAKRDLTPIQFVDLVTATSREERDLTLADAKVFAELERRRLAALEAAEAASKQEGR